MRYADVTAGLAKNEQVFKNILYKLVKTEKIKGSKWILKKIIVTRITRKKKMIDLYIKQTKTLKHLKKVEQFNYLGNIKKMMANVQKK